MLAEEFLQLADSLPEALILLNSQGEIIAANKKSAEFLLGDRSKLAGRSIFEFSSSPQEKIQAALRAWSRSRTAIPAALNWKTTGYTRRFTGVICSFTMLLGPKIGRETSTQ